MIPFKSIHKSNNQSMRNLYILLLLLIFNNLSYCIGTNNILLQDTIRENVKQKNIDLQESTSIVTESNVSTDTIIHNSNKENSIKVTKKKKEELKINDGQNTNITTSENKESDGSLIPYLIAIFIIFLILKYIWSRYESKCNKCGKWAAMKEINSENIGVVYKNEKETTKYKDKNGNVYRTSERMVSKPHTKYQITRRCINCGHVDTITKVD